MTASDDCQYLLDICKTIETLQKAESMLLEQNDPNCVYDSLKTYYYCRGTIERLTKHVYLKHDPSSEEHTNLLEKYNIKNKNFYQYS